MGRLLMRKHRVGISWHTGLLEREKLLKNARETLQLKGAQSLFNHTRPLQHGFVVCL